MMAGPFLTLAQDLKTACQLLTRLPVNALPPQIEIPDLSRSVWAYPVIGAAVGALAGIGYFIADLAGLPPLIGALVALFVSLLTTGAFHEDGLADTADGIGGGQSRERKLEIMRDSRLGTYGAAALFLSLALKTAALATLGEPLLVFAALVTMGGLSRAGIAVIIAALPAARTGNSAGLATVAQNPPAWALWTSLGLGVICAGFWGLGIGTTIALAAAVAWGAMAWLGRRFLGGYTGDLLGASQQVSEIAGLLVLCAAFAS